MARKTLRAKIDMAHGNMNMRDPIMYRIMHEPPHHRTGKKWCIYPMYDWAQGQNDAMHGVTHSLCSIEYEDHRIAVRVVPERAGDRKSAAPDRVRPAQPELHRDEQAQAAPLVEEKYVSGWDDPRMPTLRGMRRRGVHPGSHPRIHQPRRAWPRPSTSRSGVMVDMALLEACVRDDLNKRSPRKMAVLNPLKVVIENYPEGQVEEFEAVNNPEDPAGHAQGALLEGDLHRTGRFPRGSPAQVLPPDPRARSAPALRLFHQVRERGQGRRPARSSSCAAPTTRPPAAATRPMGARSKPPCTGSRRRTPSRPKCACTTGCSTTRTRKKAATSLPT